MKKQIDLLINLQKIDSEIKSLKEIKELFPEELNASLSNRNKINKNLENLKKNLDIFEKDKKEKEKEIIRENDQLIKFQSKSKEIKTNKEYTSLLEEIEFAKDRISKSEDRQLEDMEKIEEKKIIIARENQILKEEELQINNKKKEIDKKIEEINNSLAEKIIERTSLKEALEPEYYQIYANIFNSRHDLSVVELVEGTCHGCFISIPPQIENEVKQNLNILQCPHCQRILYIAN